MARLFVLVCLLIVSAGAACVPLAPGGTASAPATGIDGAASRQAVIADEGHAVMVGRTLVLRQAARTAYLVEVAQIRHSGQTRLRMESAWRDGHRLPFTGASRSEPYCLAHRACQAQRTGTFDLTQAQFNGAATTGLRATLVGPDAAVAVHIPPALFAEARDRARSTGIWPGPS
jgi:hypothetical protein